MGRNVWRVTAETMERCFTDVQLVTIGPGLNKGSDCQHLYRRNMATDWRAPDYRFRGFLVEMGEVWRKHGNLMTAAGRVCLIRLLRLPSVE